jgi:general secretion pathway protein J
MKARQHFFSMQHSEWGFTLIELLVSLVILALLSVAGYRGLDAVIQTRERVAIETRKWQHLMFFFSRLDQDIAQAIHRSIRDQGGIVRPEWIGHPVVVGDEDAELSFTRAGTTDQGALSPQRISYRLTQGNIEEMRWPSLDLAPLAKPVHYTILKGVREFKWRYLDANGNWQLQWPVTSIAGTLPYAAELTLTMATGDKIVRVFALQ